MPASWKNRDNFFQNAFPLILLAAFPRADVRSIAFPDSVRNASFGRPEIPHLGGDALRRVRKGLINLTQRPQRARRAFFGNAKPPRPGNQADSNAAPSRTAPPTTRTFLLQVMILSLFIIIFPIIAYGEWQQITYMSVLSQLSHQVCPL